MLSFEEFKAVKNRENLQKEATASPAVPSATKKPTKEKQDPPPLSLDEDEPQKPKESSPKPSSSWRLSLGAFLEQNQTQHFYLILLLLDTFIAFAETSLIKASLNTPTVLRLLSIFQAFAIFCNFFFAIEICLSFLAFGFTLLGHWGYMLDSLVISCQLSWEYVGIGRETRVLNILRIWRLFRLVNSMIALERESKEKVQRELQQKVQTIAELGVKVSDQSVEMEKEREARKAVEEMLLNYKEEVDTLNEALKIAAMDIAEVGQEDDEDLFSLDSEEQEIAVKEEGSKTAGGGGSVSSARKALGGIISAASSISGSAGGGGPQEERARMFVVKEDGTYMNA